MIRTLSAAGAYFAVVFLLGFALGTVRVLLIAPRLGETAAVVLETPVMLAASWIAAAWCVRRFTVPRAAGPRLAMGGVAFVLLLGAELSLSVLLFGRTPAEHLATYGTAPGLTGLLAQTAFALFPLLQGLRVRD